MKKIIMMAIIAIGNIFISHSQNNAAILYGAIQKAQLMEAPYAEWYSTTYDSYRPDSSLLLSLRKLNTKDVTIAIFMGTWCGDSKREVPRFMRLMHDLSFPEKNISIIGLGGGDSLYKQAPGHEEAGKGIYRVPVFIVYKNGIEINRINEFPVYSLEKDMYSILSNQSYSPNYKSFGLVRNWIADGALLNKNNNTRGLAMQLRTLVSNERELNSLGYLLIGQGQKEEALRIFQMNAALYPESPNILSSLGEGYLKTGDKKNAVLNLERALELNKDPQLFRPILKLLYEAKGVQ
jgi:tetratricopeptide (TPR) repeat protein